MAKKQETETPMILEINLETGETFNRPATSAELAQMEADEKEAAEIEAATIAAEMAKRAVLERLAAGTATYEDLASIGL